MPFQLGPRNAHTSQPGEFRRPSSFALFVAAASITFAGERPRGQDESSRLNQVERRIYLAAPGVRDYVELGGEGILRFDVDRGHRFTRRIPFRESGKPQNVKGIAASGSTLFVTTLSTLYAIDLKTEEVRWTAKPKLGCDRLAASPDGKSLYVPSLEREVWYVLSAETGAEVAVVKVEKSAHNTIFSPAGGEVFLADRHSKKLRVLDASTNKISRTVGPFSNFVRPFTVDGSARRVYVCCDDRLGFEIGDLKTGAVVDVIDVEGFTRGPVARHSCPCHGIGMTPDETEIWLCDSFNRRLHVFDLTASRPRLKQSVEVRDEPGWITFGLDGKFAYPSTGEVIDAATKKIVAKLVDEKERAVHGEKLLEIDVVTKGGETSFVFGDQFGVGRKPVSRERIDLTPRVSAPRLSDQRQRGDARDEADRR